MQPSIPLWYPNTREVVTVMKENGKRPAMTKATKDGNGTVSQRKRDERKRKEQKLLEAATDLVIEMYGPALKELEKH